MPVWYVYRSFDMGPTGKLVRRFDEDDTVLAWFQRHWEHLAVADQETAQQRCIELLGIGYPFYYAFHVAAEQAAPETIEEVGGHLRSGTAGSEPFCSPHLIETMAEDDGEGGAVCWFDGHFLKESRGRAAYLLHKDWRLPTGCGAGEFVPSEKVDDLEPAGDGSGATYAIFLVQESKYPLEDLAPPDRIAGVRLPDLARWLLTAPPMESGYLRIFPALMLAGKSMPDPMEQAFLDSIRADANDAASWAAWSDWREERSLEPPGTMLLRDAFARMARLGGEAQQRLYGDWSEAHLFKLEETPRATAHSLIHVEPHLAQMCLDASYTDAPHFDQWIFFDDLWASAHPDLANALLRWCGRWDVLAGK